LPDPSTVRRWAQRRLISLWYWVKAGVQHQHFLQSPTILAWDLGALCRILPLDPELSGKYRVFSPEFKEERVAQRILNGESVSALYNEFQSKRSVLYRWRDAYRQEGAAGLQRRIGRPPGAPNRPRTAQAPASPQETAAGRVAELERKVGQQALDIDFLRRAFKRVKDPRRKSTEAGVMAWHLRRDPNYDAA